ncbi:hypothetical protein Efla_000331 [Eimeria flavescens]
MKKSSRALGAAASISHGESAASRLRPHAALNALVRMRIDSDLRTWGPSVSKSTADEATFTRLRLLEAERPLNLQRGALSAQQKIPCQAACVQQLEAALERWAVRFPLCSNEAKETAAPQHVLKLKAELSDLREWGLKLQASAGSSSSSCVAAADCMHPIRKPLFEKRQKKDIEEEADENVFQPEVPDGVLVRQLLEAKRKGPVHAMIDFFEGKGTTSEHVRMLELENRQLCKDKAKLEAQLHAAINKAAEAEKAKASACLRVAQLDSSVALKQQALELEAAAKEMNALRKQLKDSKQTLAQSSRDLQAAKEHAVELEEALAEKSRQQIALASQVATTATTVRKLPADERGLSTAGMTTDANLTDALIRVERLAWACETLGNEKLVAVESYNRAKAKEALAHSEAEIYKKYLDDVVKERDHFYETAIKTKQASIEREAYYKSNMESERQRFAAALQEKDREISALKETQKANEQALKRASASHLECMELIRKQRELLKKTASEYEDLTNTVKEGTTEARQLKKLAALLIATLEGLRPQGPSGVLDVASAVYLCRRLVSCCCCCCFCFAAGLAHAAAVAAARAKAAALLAAAVAAATTVVAGFAPSAAEVSAFESASGGRVSLSLFREFCNKSTHADDDPEQFASLFELWDPSNCGFVTKQQMKNILSSFGDGLNPEEIQFALDVIAQPGDRINYRDFCRR